MKAQDIVQEQEYTETVKDLNNLQDIKNTQTKEDVGSNPVEDCELPDFI